MSTLERTASSFGPNCLVVPKAFYLRRDRIYLAITLYLLAYILLSFWDTGRWKNFKI